MRSTTRDDDARLDIYARGFWGRSEDAFFDVRVMNLNALSFRHLEPSACYRRAEKEKDCKYGERVRCVEHGAFTPLVFSTTGGVGTLAAAFLKCLCSRLADKQALSYSVTMVWLRCRLNFSLLRSAIMCLRGSRLSVRRQVVPEALQPSLAACQAYITH